MPSNASFSPTKSANRATTYIFLCSLPLLAASGVARAEPLTVGTAAVNAAKAAVAHNVTKNFEGASRETNTVDKIVKTTIGVSPKDIRKYGVWGGRNSIFRKPFG